MSRDAPVCNAMCYVAWLHSTLARWVVGEPATHEACNALLAQFPRLRDLHPGNVVAGRGAVVVDCWRALEAELRSKKVRDGAESEFD